MIKHRELIDKYKSYVKNIIPIEILDIGAKGSIPRELYSISDIINITGFEPNQDEFIRLNSLENINYLPFAIGKENIEESLYITKYPSSTSLYKIDEDIVSRFWDYENLQVVKEEKIKCVNLNFLLENKKINQPNFLKIDVEGAEYDVLEGASEIISNDSCLGIKIECRFDTWYVNSKNIPNKTFSEIDIYLRKFGYKLYDLKTFNHGRKSLNHTYTLMNKGETVPGGSTKYGQISVCDAIYFKDPVLKNNNLRFDTKDPNLIKMAILMDVYSQFDSAAEILKILSKKDVIFKDILNFYYVDWYKRQLKFDTFQKKINKLNKKNNLSYINRKELLYNIILSSVRLIYSFFPKKILKKMKDKFK